jgi:hypothetical protein
MDFKKLREAAGLNLDEVVILSGWAKGTISDLENHDKGSGRLREKLLEVYGLKKGSEQNRFSETTIEYHDSSSEVELWKRRAKVAEQELADLKTNLRALLSQKPNANPPPPGQGLQSAENRVAGNASRLLKKAGEQK